MLRRVKRLVTRPPGIRGRTRTANASAAAAVVLPLRRRATLLGAAGLVVLGLLGLNPSLGRRLDQESYDLLFRLRPARSTPAPDELVIIRMDDDSRANLGQRKEFVWSRELHTRLVDRLREAGSRAVLFDLLLAEPTDADAPFADAMARHGRVVLSANRTRRSLPGVGVVEVLERPVTNLVTRAAGVGLLNVVTGRDGVARRLLAGRQASPGAPWEPSLAWIAASLEGRNLAEARNASRANLWLNYYGPAGHLPSLSYLEALEPESAPRLRDKLVVVGANFEVDFPGTRKDTFPSPFGAGRLEMPGLELHATSLLNLVRGEWLERLPAGVEALLVLLSGLGLGLVLPRLRPPAALAAAAAFAGLVTAASLALGWSGLRWWSWLVPVALQTPAGLAWAWGAHLLLLGQEREFLRRSLATYLSPHVVDQILARPESFRLGGDVRRVAILFTDITDFSRLSERLPAGDLVRILNEYYEAAIRCIHDAEGTVLGIFGDGLLAVWNAPVDQDTPERHALDAAFRLARTLRAFEQRPDGPVLRTRIGLHSGEACVGNFGSSEHCAYTAIGEAVNLTSRLNGLNKQLGTEILLSRTFEEAVRPTGNLRALGRFRFQGFDRAIEVFQPGSAPDRPDPGTPPPSEADAAAEAEFAGALTHLAEGRLPEALSAFERVLALRPSDGPARFYLSWIGPRAGKPDGLPGGVVELDSK